jgi:nucleotide-binding universal stress UspA family protein
MATRGHDGVLDTLLGSHTERVLRAVRCPVLVVPVSAALEARIGAEAQS